MDAMLKVPVNLVIIRIGSAHDQNEGQVSLGGGGGVGGRGYLIFLYIRRLRPLFWEQ